MKSILHLSSANELADQFANPQAIEDEPVDYDIVEPGLQGYYWEGLATRSTETEQAKKFWARVDDWHSKARTWNQPPGEAPPPCEDLRMP